MSSSTAWELIPAFALSSVGCTASFNQAGSAMPPLLPPSTPSLVILARAPCHPPPSSRRFRLCQWLQHRRLRLQCALDTPSHPCQVQAL
jgi:hypothetical protein